MNPIDTYLADMGIVPSALKLRELAAILEKMPRVRESLDAPRLLCKYGKCGGAGFLRYDVPVGHPLFGKVIACECTKDKAMQTDEQRIAEYRKQMSPTEQTWTLKNWIGTDDNARAAAKAAIEHPYGIKVFIGPYGIGKSGLLAAIVNSALDRKLQASYWVLNELLNKLRGAYGVGMGEFESLLNQICTVRVLALDEMSAYKPSEWADQTLRTIFDERYRYYTERLTVLGSNEMIQHDAIVSRLHDQVRSQIVYMQGTDLRPAAKDLADLLRSQTDAEWLLDEADALGRETDERYA